METIMLLLMALISVLSFGLLAQEKKTVQFWTGFEKDAENPHGRGTGKFILYFSPEFPACPDGMERVGKDGLLNWIRTEAQVSGVNMDQNSHGTRIWFIGQEKDFFKKKRHPRLPQVLEAIRKWLGPQEWNVKEISEPPPSEPPPPTHTYPLLPPPAREVSRRCFL